MNKEDVPSLTVAQQKRAAVLVNEMSGIISDNFEKILEELNLTATPEGALFLAKVLSAVTGITIYHNNSGIYHMVLTLSVLIQNMISGISKTIREGGQFDEAELTSKKFDHYMAQTLDGIAFLLRDGNGEELMKREITEYQE